jgi:hypothetical protein
MEAVVMRSTPRRIAIEDGGRVAPVPRTPGSMWETLKSGGEDCTINVRGYGR